MTRAAFLLFGGIAYAVFFATFLYLIGFVGDLPGLPRTIDRGPAAAAPSAAAVNLGLIALFGLQHSIMARQGFKRAWTRIVPEPIERSVYVLFSSAALILLFLFWQPMPASVWRVDQPVAAALIWALFALGWLIVLTSTFLLSHVELFGLKQVWNNLRGHVAEAPRFGQPFFYRLVRHPLYSGFLLAFWATPAMSAGHLLFAVGMSAYMLIAIRLEERDLVDLFGDRYRSYRQEVGMLLPRLRRRSSQP